MIGDCYRDLPNAAKRRMIGSIFPEKVIFDGNTFRTAKLNEAVELIFNVGKGLRQKKVDKIMLKMTCPLPLPDLDSNQDILNQNQLYYPYTIRQSSANYLNGLQK